MSFWAFCCKFPQVHRVLDDSTSPYQYPKTDEACGRFRRPQLAGAPNNPFRSESERNLHTIDNEGDWTCLGDYAGIQSDGTLWCWIPQIVEQKAYQYGLGSNYPSDMPVKISDDTDWTYVTADVYHGFAIKSDGSLWAFGFNEGGNLGIGLAKSGYSPDFDAANYRARLSCSIASVAWTGTAEFTKKPTPVLRCYKAGYYTSTFNTQLPEELGTGATFEVDWTGAVKNEYVTVTAGGSGYTSPPTVTLVPTSSADAGKSVSGTVTSMTPVSIAGFEVVSGGGGYTQATAVEATTGATATAIIQGGVITGWTVTSSGPRTVSLTAPYSLSVTVSGDGSGAAASATLQTSSVLAVSFSEEKVWTSTPTVAFSGGGGSGAAASVSKIKGKVDAIRVTNGGSGYTQSKNTVSAGCRLLVVLLRNSQDDQYSTSPEEKYGSTVKLSEGPVQSFVVNLEKSPVALLKQSTGTVKPFVNYAYSATGKTVDMVSPYVDTVSLSTASGYPSNDTERHGYKYPPFFIARNVLSVFPELGSATASLNLARDFQPIYTDPCVPQYASPRKNYVAPRAYFPWPVAQQQIVLSGQYGESATYVNVDGYMKLQSRSFAELDQTTYNTIVYSSNPHQGITASTQPTLHTGAVSAMFMNIYDFNNGSSAGILAQGIWTPPTIEEVLRLYAEAPSGPGVGAYGEVRPDQDGNGTSPTIVTQGGNYTEEPRVREVSGFFEYPVRVGSDTWQSVSIGSQTNNASASQAPSGGYLRSFGVTTSGELYWWGSGTANGALPCTSPAPVGRGVAIDVSPPDGQDDFKTNGMAAYGPGYGNARAFVSPPNHGVYHAIPPSLSTLGIGDNRGNRPTDPYTGYSYSTAEKKVIHPGLPARDRWFASDPTVIGRNLVGYAYGCGYTSTPSVTLISIGDPLAKLTPRLIGPTEFTKVVGPYARDTAGAWYYVAPFSGGRKGDRPVYSYTVTSSSTSKITSVDDLDADSAIVTRTKIGDEGEVDLCIVDGGEGYTTSASLSVPYTYLSTYSGGSTTTSTVAQCGQYNNPVLKTTTVAQYTPAASQGTFTAALSGGAVAGVMSVSGRIAPAKLTVLSVASQPSLSNCITDTGSGAGAVVEATPVSAITESHIRPVTPPGVSEEFVPFSLIVYATGFSYADQYFYVDTTNRSRVGIEYYSGYGGNAVASHIGILPSGDLAEFPYGPTAKAYKSSRHPTGLTQLRGNGTARKQSNQSLWFLQEDGLLYRRHLSAARRMFPVSLEVTSTGRGYDDVATASVSQPSGVARASVTFDGKVLAIGVMSQGMCYSSPPAVTLTAIGGGNAGTATAVIAGPIDQVTITSGGSGYRLPPRVVFSGAGISPSATCQINESGEVTSVRLSSGGRYRNAAPTVSFSPIVQVESLTLTEGGSGYSVAPDVYIGGGGGIGATATCRIRATVVEIVLVAGGSGYASSPTVVIRGGEGTGASATATVSDGAVTLVSIVLEGDYYQTAPTVSFVGGGGSGAKATAKISGYVDQLTLTTRGEDFVNPPEVVFYNGGGSGAAATAVLGAAGSGASATARLNGSVIFCKHNNDSSGLQQPPAVTVSHSTNYGITQLAQTSDEQAQYAAVLKSRIAGKVTGIEVTNGGQGYKANDDQYGNYRQPPSIDDPRIVAAAIVSPTHADGDAYAASAGDYAWDEQGIPLTTTVSGDGVVTGVTRPSSFDNLLFWKKPTVTFADGISATPYSCLTIRGCAVVSATASSGSAEVRYSGVSVNGVRSVLGSAAAAYLGSPRGVSAKGRINSFSTWVSGAAPLFSTSSGYLKLLFYSTLPTVTIEDETGTGAIAAMATISAYNGALGYSTSGGLSTPTLAVTSGGSGYTLASRPVIKGGTPKCWSNKASATASVSQGAVTGVSVSNQGDGYSEIPEVILFGGGGSGATAKATLTLGRLTSIQVTSPGSGYTSSPSVAIVDKDRPFDKTDIGIAAQAAMDGVVTPVIRDYTVEFALHGDRATQLTTTHAMVAPAQYGATFAAFFDDNGYVEDIHWNVGSLFGFREYTTAPAVTATANESPQPATYESKIVGWSSVFSGGSVKTA